LKMMHYLLLFILLVYLYRTTSKILEKILYLDDVV
jgi:hypothetical protein